MGCIFSKAVSVAVLKIHSITYLLLPVKAVKIERNSYLKQNLVKRKQKLWKIFGNVKSGADLEHVKM